MIPQTSWFLKLHDFSNFMQRPVKRDRNNQRILFHSTTSCRPSNVMDDVAVVAAADDDAAE